jgi:hypothetical protein
MDVVDAVVAAVVVEVAETTRREEEHMIRFPIIFFSTHF